MEHFLYVNEFTLSIIVFNFTRIKNTVVYFVLLLQLEIRNCFYGIDTQKSARNSKFHGNVRRKRRKTLRRISNKEESRNITK